MDIKQLYRKAWLINCFFYPFRNNERNVSEIFFGFKHCVGLDDWQNVRPDIRNSWESAANNFDRLYGQLKIYRLVEKECFQDVFILKKTEKQSEILLLKKTLDESLEIIKILNEYEEKFDCLVDYGCLGSVFGTLDVEEKIKKIVLAYFKKNENAEVKDKEIEEKKEKK